jgi:hypothetical protein
MFRDDELEHAVAVATNGRRIFHIERIVDWKNTRGRGQATGCAHAYCRAEDQDDILLAHHRILFDNGGVWCASVSNKSLLVAHAKDSFAARQGLHGPPTSGLMTVQKARSTYIPLPQFSVKIFRH